MYIVFVAYILQSAVKKFNEHMLTIQNVVCSNMLHSIVPAFRQLSVLK